MMGDEGGYQVMDPRLLERQTTFSLTLTESTLWRWQQIAQEQRFTNNAALACFLLRYYDETRTRSLIQKSFCTSCGSELSQFCNACFSLVPKLQQQVCSSQTAVSRECATCHKACQTNIPSCPYTSNHSHHLLKSEHAGVSMPALKDTGSTTVSLEDDDDDINGIDNNDDDMDDGNYASKTVETKEPGNEDFSGAQVGRAESSYDGGKSETLTCGVCSQLFCDPDQLVKHTQTHRDRMPHACRQCQARFFQEEVLQLHLNSHLQQEKQRCDPPCSASVSISTTDTSTKHTTLTRSTKPKRGKRVLTEPTSGASRPQASVETRDQTTEKGCDHQEREQSHHQPHTDHQQQSATLSETHNVEDSEAKACRTKLACVKCGQEFRQKNWLDHTLSQRGEKQYGCQQCGAAFAQLAGLVIHMRCHNSHKPFQCGQCSKSFNTASYMARHVCRGSRPQLQCGVCGDAFRTQDQLSLHRCPKTEETSTNKNGMTGVADQESDRESDSLKMNKERRKRSTNMEENEEVVIQKRTRGRPRKNGRSHAKTKDKDSRTKTVGEEGTPPGEGIEENKESHPHCCHYCGARFMLLSDLTCHLQDHTGEKAFKCSLCAKSFKSMARLAAHLPTHNTSKDFPCQYCSKVLKSPYTLKEHLRSHTGEKPFKCSVCDSSFTLRSTYKAHLRTHTGDRPYLCPHCGKSFVRSSNLSVHIRACTGDKPYTCSQCGKSFSDVGYYKKHVDNHAGIRPYKCEYCGKAFSQSTSLKLHIRIHTGEKPYRCSECPMAFAIPNSLKEHMRKHSGVKPFKCSICGKGFAKSCNRLAHLRTHKNKPTPLQAQSTDTSYSVLRYHLTK